MHGGWGMDWPRVSVGGSQENEHSTHVSYTLIHKTCKNGRWQADFTSTEANMSSFYHECIKRDQCYQKHEEHTDIPQKSSGFQD